MTKNAKDADDVPPHQTPRGDGQAIEEPQTTPAAGLTEAPGTAIRSHASPAFGLSAAPAAGTTSAPTSAEPVYSVPLAKGSRKHVKELGSHQRLSVSGSVRTRRKTKRRKKRKVAPEDAQGIPE